MSVFSEFSKRRALMVSETQERKLSGDLRGVRNNDCSLSN
jgi:hypothetical protein